MDVFLLQRVPAFVVAKHRFAEFSPAVFLVFAAIPKPLRAGGLQMLQGAKPSFPAFWMLRAEDTFLTIRQVDR